MRLTPASILGVRMPRSLKLLDSLKSSERFEQELITKARQLVVVILDRLIEFLLSYVEKTNLHYLTAVFCENLFERNGLQSPLVVRPDAIFYFLSPQSVDRFVRLIKAGQKLINDQGLVGRRKTQRSIDDCLGFGAHVANCIKQALSSLSVRLQSRFISRCPCASRDLPIVLYAIRRLR